MRLAWLTDLHLDFVDPPVVDALAREVLAARPDAILIGGDIGMAADVVGYLERLSALLPLPIFFVLGNHDFYGGSIASLRAEVGSLARRASNLTYLTGSGPVALTRQTSLIGHDGWGDGGFGNTDTTPVVLNDFLCIDELRVPDRLALSRVLRELGEEAARHFQVTLPPALQDHEHVVVLTHVPPFRQAAWHQGRESDADWIPFFACKAAGEVLRRVMAEHPDRRLTVLCGHTHGQGRCRVTSNIDVITGSAEYGRPRLQDVIEID